MDLNIISPEKEFKIHNVSLVSFNGTAGRFQVLPGHAEMVSIIKPGHITYRIANNEQQINIQQKAVVKIKDDIIQVFV